MKSTTQFSFLDEALQFLSKEWAYAKLDPKSSTTPTNSGGDTVPTNANHSPVVLITNDNVLTKTMVLATPAIVVTPPTDDTPKSQHTATAATNTICPAPTADFPFDEAEADQVGCIMAFLLAERRAAQRASSTSAPTRAPARELITNTTTPWKWGEEEKERDRKAAIRAKDKSIVGCEGLAASRWCSSSSTTSKTGPSTRHPAGTATATASAARSSHDHKSTATKTSTKCGDEEKERRQRAARLVKATRTPACAGLAASRWYTGSACRV